MLGSFFFQGSGGLSLARQREKGFCFFFKERGAISWFREPEKSNRGVVQGAKKMKTSGGGAVHREEKSLVGSGGWV